MIALKRILVATDFGEPADAALEYGRALARTFGATLHVLHVVQDIYLSSYGSEFYIPDEPNMQNQLNESARRQLEDRAIDSDGSGPATHTELRMAKAPARAIVEYAADEKIDLLVMGTRGRKGATWEYRSGVSRRGKAGVRGSSSPNTANTF